MAKGRQRGVKRRPYLWAIVLGLALGVAAPLALAETFDPTAPVVRVIGQPDGPAPRARLDAARTGRSRQPLPELPVELWRREMAGLDMPPVVAAGGDVVVAMSMPAVARLSSKGKELWRLSLGRAPARVPPVLTSDGSVAVLTTDNELWRISKDGKPLVRVSLGKPLRRSQRRRSRRDPPATPLALDDASVIVALDDSLVRVDAGGQVVARQRVSAPVGGLIRWRDSVLVTSRSGQVLAWEPPLRTRTVGSLGGRPYGGALLASDRTLVSVVDRNVLVALDLNSGTTTPLVTSSTVLSRLEGPPAMDHRDRLLVTTALGELLAFDGHGVLAERRALDNLALFAALDAGASLPRLFRRAESRPSPGLITDPDGRIAFTRGTGRVGLVRRTGELMVIDNRLCRLPLAVLPAGERRMLVACRSGTLALYGTRTP